MNKNVGIGLGMYVMAFGGCASVVEEPPVDATAHVRVAHLSPDAPAVDFCLAAAGTGEFAGPVLAGAGGGDGLAYTQVTRYLDVPAGTYDVRLVAPGAADCARSLGNLPDVTDLPALDAGVSVTIAAEGLLAGGPEPFALRAYIDDVVANPDHAKLRFIHASPGTPAVDLGLGGGATFAPVFENIPYAGIAADGGYITTPPFSGAELSARATGSTTDVIAIKPAALDAGTITTAFAIGRLGDATTPLRVLVCADRAATDDLLTPCTVAGAAPERARVRVAHLSPDAPAVDVCLAPAGGAFDQPLLAALGDRLGLAYPQVTRYVELPLGTYDIRVIAATDLSCDNPVVPDTRNVELAPNLTATIAAIGDLERSGMAIADPGFRLAVFPDATSVPAGKLALRFIHASPGTPNVDVGLGAGSSFLRLFGNVEFGKFAVHGGIDPIGYLETNPFTSTVSARATGATTDAIVIHGVSIGAGTLATAFAIGGKSGQATNPLRVLLCDDTADTGTLLSACTVAPSL